MAVQEKRPYKIQFIINPISGGKKKHSIPALIEEHLNEELFDYNVWIWDHVDALQNEVEKLKSERYDGIIAVGGDGTINQIARKLIGSQMFIGFIPMGSGNGLTRQLKIPQEPSEAIAHLNKCKVKEIDTAEINGQPFVNVAGVGFDARVSRSFAKSKKRGLLNYSRCVIGEYREAQNADYKITIDNRERNVKAFMLSIANGAQWGNDFFVAPNASLDDGVLDVVIMSKPSLTKIPKLMVDLNRQQIQDNSLVEIVKGRDIRIQCTQEVAHVDGEAGEEDTDFSVKVKPLSLKVFV